MILAFWVGLVYLITVLCGYFFGLWAGMTVLVIFFIAALMIIVSGAPFDAMMRHFERVGDDKITKL